MLPFPIRTGSPAPVRLSILGVLLFLLVPLLSVLILAPACTPAPEYDVVIRGGTLYDGSGSPGVVADLAISGDTVAALGDLRAARGRQEVDAHGMAVSPGFINLMSWANESMIEDGRAMSDVMQGVTLQVMGEGDSMGPIPDSLKEWAESQQGDIQVRDRVDHPG
jgi:N-acyl-D-amino-acid deacylase